jgi:hypothetical protein
MKAILFALALLLVACSSGGGSHHHVPSPTPGPNESGWIIGPIVHGKNYSVGMPARPVADGVGWYFDFPAPGGQVDYVLNFSPPSLVGAKALVMTYRVEGSGIVPVDHLGSARVCLGIQRRGDDWSGKAYRWYSQSRPVLTAGEFTLSVPLNSQAMNDVQGKTGDAAAFDATIRDLDDVFVAFGSDGPAGHGVYATAPARFILVALTVER